MEHTTFSIHGLVNISVPATFPFRQALERELEPFRVHAVLREDILLARIGGISGLDFHPIHPGGPFVAFDGKQFVLACNRDPLSFVLPLVEWVLLQQSHSLVHAAGVGLNGKGVLLPATGGVGKTAAVQKLCSLPHASFLGDDLVILSDQCELLSFPKPMFIYPYHRELFPHVFAKANKFVVPKALTRAVGAIRRLIRPLLRAFPRVEEFGRQYTPEHIHTPARVALPGVEFSTRLPLSLVLYLERYPGQEVRLEKLDAEKYSAIMTEILIREMGIPAGELLDECFRHELIPKAQYVGLQKKIFQKALRSRPAYKLSLPDNLQAKATGETISEKVQQLLGSIQSEESATREHADKKAGAP